jgi:hypothetical protein
MWLSHLRRRFYQPDPDEPDRGLLNTEEPYKFYGDIYLQSFAHPIESTDAAGSGD